MHFNVKTYTRVDFDYGIGTDWRDADVTNCAINNDCKLTIPFEVYDPC